jgi:signal transduction histidine kinase
MLGRLVAGPRLRALLGWLRALSTPGVPPTAGGGRHPTGEQRVDRPPARADGGLPVERVFDAHPDPMLYYVDRDGEPSVAATNTAFDATFPTDGTSLVDAIPVADGAAGVVEEIRTRPAVDMERQCHDGDGAARYRLRAKTLADDGGLVVFTELPADYPADALRRENERLEEFASIVSHDLRNLIDVARTRVDAGADTGNHTHFEKSIEALDRMTDIVEDLLTLVRDGRIVESPRRVDPTEAARIAWRTVETGDATLTVVDDLPTLSADPGPLQQLLENLFRNAVQHGSTDGRSVAVTVGRLDGGFYVADDGPGIPPDEREAVFEAGYTTERDGTGLGLRIVERIARAHGWDVTATESENGGARFEVVGVEWD